jgi:hypothetical protein
MFVDKKRGKTIYKRLTEIEHDTVFGFTFIVGSPN